MSEDIGTQAIRQDTGTVLTPMSEWMNRLDDLRQLKRNWNQRGALPPNDLALSAAELFLKVMSIKRRVPSRVAPSAVGGVGITLREGDRIAYAEFYNSGTACLLLSDDMSEGETFRVAVDADSFAEAIDKMEAFLHG
jgi:hypothetical protein